MKKLLSIFSFRTLLMVGALFACSLDGFAVYFETIEANKDFYIYNVSAKKYIKNNNGQLVMTELSDASTWQFSGTSGSVSVKNGSYYISAAGAAGTGLKDSYPGSSATGNVELTTSSEKMNLSGDVKKGYVFSISKKYNYGFGSSYTYYFAYNGSSF